MSYRPGSHLIATLKTEQQRLLDRSGPFAELVNSQVDRLGLQKLGDVYHDFHPAGFTAVVCLSESHLSVHTWPEYGMVNLDIYLSNHLRVNDGIVLELFAAIKHYFNAKVEKELLVTR